MLAAERFGGSPEAVRFADARVSGEGWQIDFDELVTLAYQARVQLWSDGFYATPGLHWDRDSLTGSPFFYFAYGAAVSEVAVDTLSGEWKLLRADLLHDAGNSINPAIDIGQVEGAYIQGMGWLTTEELVWNAEGRLTTHARQPTRSRRWQIARQCSTPGCSTTPTNVDTIMRSKAVGEPPCCRRFGVLCDPRCDRGGRRRSICAALTAPATGEAILGAVDAVRAAQGEPVNPAWLDDLLVAATAVRRR